ncbi:uncharacterized protein [Periplaneta americana]|uniref:uncharacterized protein n=1 Tax=Periplaneta americana TaxID=6978 RepID=UPI0037E7951F
MFRNYIKERKFNVLIEHKALLTHYEQVVNTPSNPSSARVGILSNHVISTWTIAATSSETARVSSTSLFQVLLDPACGAVKVLFDGRFMPAFPHVGLSLVQRGSLGVDIESLRIGLVLRMKRKLLRGT